MILKKKIIHHHHNYYSYQIHSIFLATIRGIDICSVLCLERDEFETIIGDLDSLLKLAGIRSMIVSTFKYYQCYDLN